MRQLRYAVSLLVALLATYLCCRAQSSNPIVYVYDELGRLVAVTDPNSDTVRYSYDAVGNIVSIARYSSTQLSIIRFDPGSGPTGSAVTISGTGFSSTPSQNTVQFNGTGAAVTAATTTQLIVTVPNGATTGPITVTAPAGTATTTNSFTVTATNGLPSITSFTPTLGVPGTGVTIAGANFDPTVINNELSFNVSRGTPSTATTTSLTASVPSSATSGHIAVRTQAGKGVSTGYFFVPPPPYSASSVQFTGQIATGGQANVSIGTAGNIGLLVFEGTQGRGVSLTTSSGTFGSCGLSASILTPTGTTLTSYPCMGTSGLLGSVTLPMTGTYTILFATNGSATGSVTVNLYDATDITGTITAGGPPVTSTITVPGQRVRLSFTGSYQQIISAEAAGLGGGLFTASILAPDGSTFASQSGPQASFVGEKLPVTGMYQILVSPNNGVSGSVTVSLATAATNSPINFNTLFSKSISSTSLISASFSGTAGQVVSAEAAGLNGFFQLFVLNPDGSVLGSLSNTGMADVLGKTLATTGTYQIVIVPNNGVTGSMTISLISGSTNSTIAFNTPVTNSITSSSLIGLSFSGTAGQVVSAEAAGLNGFFQLFVLNPDGSVLGSLSNTGMADVLGKTLATTGTYQIVIVPNNGVTGSMTISLISGSTNSTIAFNTPVTNSITSSSLIGLSFSGTAGQVVTAEAAGLNGFFWMFVLNPDGSVLGSASNTGTADVLGKTLATTGTYQVVIVPNSGVTGSMTISLISQSTNSTIAFNTPVASTITTSSLVGLSFSGTAGQVVSTEATGLSGNFWLYLLNPDGSQLGSSFGSSALNITGKTLATTGTYQIVIIPSNGVSGSVNVSLISQSTNGTIAFNTPVASTITTSSLVGLSFSGTAGQVVSTEAAGLNGNFWLVLLNPDGSQLGSAFGSGEENLTGKTLATTGTYQIVIIPNNGVSGSVNVSLISQSTNSTIAFNTPVTSTITASSLVALSFSGTAGQVVSTEAAGLNGNFWLVLLNPNGSQLGSAFGSGEENLTGKTLATTGRYQIVIIPNNGVTGSMTISLAGADTNGTINFNTPVTSTITASSLVALSFSGTAGQVVSTEAAGLNGNFWFVLLNPNGSQLGAIFGASQQYFTGKTLATTGTYQIVIIPNSGATGSITISLVSAGTNGTINFDSPVTSTITTSSLIALSFSGTAGQTVSVQVSPSFSGGTFAAYLLNPDGSTLTSVVSSSSVTFSGKSLGSTGTYQILIVPNNGVTGSATTTLTSP